MRLRQKRGSVNSSILILLIVIIFFSFFVFQVTKSNKTSSTITGNLIYGLDDFFNLFKQEKDVQMAPSTITVTGGPTYADDPINYAPEKTLDKESSTYWLGDYNSNSWELIYNLNEPFPINSFTINFFDRTLRNPPITFVPQSTSISVSTDGTDYNQITSFGDDGTDIKIIDLDQTIQYIKLEMSGKSTDFRPPAITEVDFNIKEICDNGIDDDNDGAIDCADAECSFELSCSCGNSLCDFAETKLNCATDCDSFLWGIGEPFSENKNQYGWDINQQINGALQTNPKIVRMWSSIMWCLNSPTEIDEENCQRYKEQSQRLHSENVVVIAMDGSFPEWLGGNFPGSVPPRGTPEYLTFLNNYEKAWETIAKEFPEVKYWETGNEPNLFLRGYHKTTPECNDGNPQHVWSKACFEQYTFEEKAAITTDLMYYAKKAINEVNPGTYIFMPAIAPVDKDAKTVTDTQGNLCLYGIDEFLQEIYSNINSGSFPLGAPPSTNPRDYFDGATTHPYSFDPSAQWDSSVCQSSNWEEANQKIYDTIRNNGDEGIPVLFSEYGFYVTPDPNIRAIWMTKSIPIMEDFDWLWGSTWFLLFDHPNEYIGIMENPDSANAYQLKIDGEVFKNYALGLPLPQCGNSLQEFPPEICDTSDPTTASIELIQNNKLGTQSCAEDCLSYEEFEPSNCYVPQSPETCDNSDVINCVCNYLGDYLCCSNWDSVCAGEALAGIPLEGNPETYCASVCGDSVKTNFESCDDGNTASSDGCSSDCQVESGWECAGDVGHKSTCTELECLTNADCDDKLFCNGIESCDINNRCQPGTAPNTEDGISCTVGSCNEATDSIDQIPNNGLCSNNLACDGQEICDLNLGCQAGTPVNCNDGISCTLDSCINPGGLCNHDKSACSCITNADCNDNNPCTDDLCTSQLTCQNSPNTANSCNDGLFCTVNDRCNSSGDCIGDPRNLDDGITCTQGTCDETQDKIIQTPINQLCDDLQFCNGIESCHPLLDCQAGTPPNTNDNIACTLDVCDETSDSITHTPLNSRCDDGLFCNGQETCNKNTGCIQGTPISCDTNDVLQVSTCNNNPDNNPVTFDFLPGFDSKCIELVTNYECTQNTATITHTCNKNCGAQCETTQDCLCPPDICIDHDGDGDLDDFANFPSNTECTAQCECGSCNPEITLNDGINCPQCTSNADCDNGKFCDGQETCNLQTGFCQLGTPIDCTQNNIAGINTCINTPDGNPKTLDFREPFFSNCQEQSLGYTCPQETRTLVHSCSIDECGAECESDSDCNDNNPNTEDICLNSCSCKNTLQDNDNDGIPDAQDRCPDSHPSRESPSPNEYGCIPPRYSKFQEGTNPNLNLTTDFSEIENLTNVKNFSLGVQNAGRIIFTDKNLNLEDANLDYGVNISHNRIEIDSTTLPQLNTAATLHFYGVIFTTPVIQRDGSTCTGCEYLSYTGGTYAVKVPGFSTYTLEETSTPNNENPSNGGSGSRCLSEWNCTAWSNCINGIKTRVCTDSNNCKNPGNLPSENSTCSCEPVWQCDDWSKCSDNREKRICYDKNNCGEEQGKPPTERGCEIPTNTSKRSIIKKIIAFTLGGILILAAILLIIILILKSKKLSPEYRKKTEANDFIEKASSRGINKQKIKQLFKDKGWSDKEIEDLKFDSI